MMTETILISFPRTGSRWLKFSMEVFIAGRALHELTNEYYQDYHVMKHTHDFNLEETHKDFIYLYRNPVDTVYSLMEYENMDKSNKESIVEISKKYAMHAKRWMIDVDSTIKKTIVAYEDLRETWNDEFEKICTHIGVEFSKDKFRLFENMTKENLKPKMPFMDNYKLINTSEEYATNRSEFASLNKEIIMKAFIEVDTDLLQYFKRYLD